MGQPSLRFLGAAQEVTGSMHLLETAEGGVLIDCGMHQGRREESRERNRVLPKEAIAARAMILTHAHIDHSGSLPTLVRSGFKGTIWATPATRDLAAYMLRDSARIQEADAAYLNRAHGEEPGWQDVQPIYDENDAIAALSRFVAVPYRTPFHPLPGVTAMFLDAGHILGSAQVVVDLEEPERRRVVFSGDLGRRGLPILRDPDLPDAANYVVMESTYGNRAHGSIKEVHDDLARAVNSTVAKKGKVLIPAFAVGRTQEIVYALSQLHQAGRIPEIPIFIDSPLAVNVTDVFRLHPECYDAELRQFIERGGDPFSFRSLRYIESREESIRLNDLAGPAIIISASGMCEAGRILHHLRNNVEDERNTVLIVGFQAQHTLGRRLVERRPRVRILGVERDVFANVVVLNAFSAHGDQHDLRDYALHSRSARRVFLVHGEPDQQEPLKETLTKDGLSVMIPKEGDQAPLD
jgi:metallo-beta-lactamase family protein